ncbi:MAG TPA: biotin/lipoyl-binding protein, partial [Thermodesulfobacteriota bacterium]
METPDEKPLPNPHKKKVLFLLAILLLGVGGYFGIQWIYFRWHHVSTDDAQVKGNLVNLSAKVSARIDRMLVEEGDSVQSGKVLVELDPKDYLAARAQAQASLEMARQDLAKAIPQLALTRDRVLQGIDTADASYKEAREGLKFAENDAALQTDRVQK